MCQLRRCDPIRVSDDQDWHNVKVEDVMRISKAWQQTLHALRVYLFVEINKSKFSRWEYGDYPLDPMMGNKRVGYVDFNRRYRDKPDHILVSFWRKDKAPTHLKKGGTLSTKDLRSLEPFIARFMKDHPDLEVSTEVKQWKITYRFSKKK